MFNFFPFGDVQMIDLSELQLGSGSVMHLATLETEEKTYLALGSVKSFERGAQVSVMMVQEKVGAEGEKTYELVQSRKELTEIIPRLLQAFMPDAELDLSEMTSAVCFEDDEEDSPFVFDCSGKQNFLS